MIYQKGNDHLKKHETGSPRHVSLNNMDTARAKFSDKEYMIKTGVIVYLLRKCDTAAPNNRQLNLFYMVK